MARLQCQDMAQICPFRGGFATGSLKRTPNAQIMTELLIGRQPIFNRSLDVIGYELFYRTPQSPNRAVIMDGDKATMEVLFNSFSMIGFENLVGQGIGFINVTENFIKGKYPIPFPPEKLALEVLETVKITPQLVEALGRLWSQGYVIVLDDVVDIARVLPLLHVAKIIKLDLPQINPEDLPGMIEYLRQLDVKLVAEKVETMAEFEMCHKLGFDLFQGYFLYKPNVVRAQGIDTSKAVIIHAMSVINNPMVTFAQLEDYISRDVTVSYKLLRVVNSAYYGNSITIRTIGQAVSMIGLERLRGWLTLLLITSSQNKPHELTVTAITRAKFCELLALARKVDPQHSGIYFVVGLFSVLNAFMDMSLEKAIQGLPLSNEIVEALLFHKGAPGEILKTVIAYERGELNKSMELNIAPEAVVGAYVETLKWVNTQMKVINEVLFNMKSGQTPL